LNQVVTSAARWSLSPKRIFIDADRVILINDRQHVPLEQRHERIAHVQERVRLSTIAGREAKSGRSGAVAIQAFLVSPHQETLPNRGAGLEMAQIGRPCAQIHPPAGADGPELT